MPTIMDKVQQYSREYRDFWNERPMLAMGMGFVPVVGQVMGFADAVAANNDERATAAERALATAGVLPMGKLASGLKSLVIGKGAAGPMLGILTGPAVLKRAQEEGTAHLLTKTHWDPELKQMVQETVGAGQVNQAAVDFSTAAGRNKADLAGRAVVDEPLHDVLPESKQTMMTFNPNNPAGSGAYTRGKDGSFGASFMQLGTGTPASGVSRRGVTDNRGLVRDDKYYDDIRGTYVHEMGHGVQAYEHSAGNFPADFLGADNERAGFFRYFLNPGELSAEADNLRKTWTREQLEDLTPYQMRQAMRKKIEENIASNRSPNSGMSALKDPAAARKYAEWANEEGIDANMMRAFREGPKWKPVPRPKGGWHEMMTPDDIMQMEPRLGEKSYKMGKDGSWSAKYSGDKTNYAQEMMFGKEIEPVRVKMRWNDDTGRLEAEDVDGLRRVVAARNMFGPGNKVPVIFEPVDDVAATMAKDPQYRGAIAPAMDIAMEDDMNFQGFIHDFSKVDY